MGRSINPGLEVMDELFARMAESRGFAEIWHRLKSQGGQEAQAVLDHTDDAGVGFASAAAIRQLKGVPRVWVIAPHLRVQEAVHSQLLCWGVENVLFLPELEAGNSNGLGDPDLLAERMTVIKKLARAEEGVRPCVVVVTQHSLDEHVPSPDQAGAIGMELQVGGRGDQDALIRMLEKNGFEQVSQVISRGQWARRGGILDVFSLQASHPVRVEFFDDEIESIREFDIDSQVSFKKLPQVELVFKEAESDCPLRAWIGSKDRVISTPGCVEPGDLVIQNEPLLSAGEEDFTTQIRGNPLGSFDAGDFVMQELRRDLIERQLKEWQDQGWMMAIFFPHQGEEKRFREICAPHPVLLSALPLRGDLPRGFAVSAAKLVVLSSSELFGRYQSAVTRRRASREDEARRQRVQTSLQELNVGDLVVHSVHGIGKYIGINVSADTGDEEMQILYKDKVTLHVPLSQSYLVSRYIGLGAKAPVLSKLGDGKWGRAKKNAERAVDDYAAQLLDLQAERDTMPGYAHPPDNQWMWDFEHSFPYRETPDQMRAILQAKADMESPNPMDRLICGDVGFGKTEVAIRAAFKAVTGGKQVAMLVPTTVLAEQHWRTFRERMSEYPVRVEMLSRFTPSSAVASILRGLQSGAVDIVIGTHRLISDDVVMSNLGLVVIDEEQRFGVLHKEKFKEKFRGIDVLTLSATPIPRTLYIALMGARDMSTIETPPTNRIPVQTSVCAYDERIIKTAIEHELERGGQVFFLHNRVKTIDMMRAKLQSLVPQAKVVVGHGQMDKEDLEVVMHSFVRGEKDVLLSTTIIESGIDIPNANTIIIDRADRFGLADLYQLRGRVGRSGHAAYAYLMLPRDAVTTGDARKRVSAIKEYTALGSGFKVAMRDLEIRGAGNLLGTKQSGHISAIGFDLYCQLLVQAVDRRKGKAVQLRTEAVLRADFLIFSETQYALKEGGKSHAWLGSFIPTAYMDEASLRIAAYKEVSNAREIREVDAIEEAWRDRFGPLPEQAETFLLCQKIKILASKSQIGIVELSGVRLMLQRNGDYILLSGKFPRLTASKPMAKLKEALEMLAKI